MKTILFTILAMVGTIPYLQATSWYIGASRTYTLPSQIKNLVQDGDTIYIDGGVYLNDATKWTKKNLTFIGLGNNSNPTILRHTGNIPNGKGIFVFDLPGLSDNPYLENIVFDGAQVSSGGNGAGIRFQAKNLTVKHCTFMNCQNGILEGHGNVQTSNVIIEDSEFVNNGYQDPQHPTYSGYAHHIYISASTDTLIVQNCYFHKPRGQANSIKTRAQRSYILYNLIDESTGYGSWEINIAQGGLNIIMGNIIIQGTSGANHGIIGYDAASNALQDFYFINNTVINKYAGNIRYFNITPSTGIQTFKLYNNVFASVPTASHTFITGNIPASLDSASNLMANHYLNLGFNDPSNNDYSLTASATQLINQGRAAGYTQTTYALLPMHMYQAHHLPLLTRISNGTIDIGAYEYAQPTALSSSILWPSITVFPNPSQDKFYVTTSHKTLLTNCTFTVYNNNGQQIDLPTQKLTTNQAIDLSSFPKGLYYLKISSQKESKVQPIILK